MADESIVFMTIISALSFICIGAFALYLSAHKRNQRLEKQLAYSQVRVVRIYKLGRMISETIEPAGQKEDGTLPLPLEQVEKVVSTRMSEWDERR